MTRKSAFEPCSHKHFNPHPREGGDSVLILDCAVSIAISIHTPAKGVTKSKAIVVKSAENFNPHPREGGDMFRLWVSQM